MSPKVQIAILDDYQKVALEMADWSAIEQQAELTIFHHHLSNENEIIERLGPFNIICVMRERTPITRRILSSLPNLRLIISTGKRNASIDVQAADELGITIKHTGYLASGAPELTWALLLALARNIPQENAGLKAGGWQRSIGTDLSGKTIGIVGLGRIGSKIASYAKAFDMNVIAWSQNLTEERALAEGAKLVSKETLFRQADFVTVHLVLSERSHGIIGETELLWMKRSAFLINTSRGPLITETALINILQQNKIAGAALDVFDTEPLPGQHPFRLMDNVLATPHIGYVTEDTYRLFYGDTVRAIAEWIKNQ